MFQKPQIVEAAVQRDCYPPNFVKKLDSVSDNGWYLNDIYLPQELIAHILTYLDGADLLKASSVCRNWFNIVRSNTYWYNKYKRLTNKQPKKVPWFVYYAYFNHGLFDRNLIKNGNGQKNFEHWKVLPIAGSHVKVQMPSGAFTLPTDVDDFNGEKSCFVISGKPCYMVQGIKLPILCRYVLDTHKPHIYMSEWVASAYSCSYMLNCKLQQMDYGDAFPLLEEREFIQIEDVEGRNWSKKDILLSKYPNGVARIVFEHIGCNTTRNLKMAGGVVKILFNTVKELTDEEAE